MNFNDAFKLMKRGHLLKLPSWYGYWYWDCEKNTIMMRCKPSDSDNKSELLDIRETQRVEYTLLNILSDDWVIANEENCPLLGGTNSFSFSDALKYLKRGLKVTRLGWHKDDMYLTMQYENNKITNPYIYINIDKDHRIPWTASQSDMYEEDWVFVD